uniref:Uncharacterized protein n=1 Tax=Romanomermis culicivorax TaxID=13658 RepID=A0A915HYI0_ROMCU
MKRCIAEFFGPLKKWDQSVQPNDIDCSQSSETATTSAELEQPEIVEYSKATQNFQSSRYDIGHFVNKGVDDATKYHLLLHCWVPDKS